MSLILHFNTVHLISLYCVSNFQALKKDVYNWHIDNKDCRNGQRNQIIGFLYQIVDRFATLLFDKVVVLGTSMSSVLSFSFPSKPTSETDQAAIVAISLLVVPLSLSINDELNITSNDVTTMWLFELPNSR